MQRLGLKRGEVNFDDSATRRRSYSRHRTWTEGRIREGHSVIRSQSLRVHTTHQNRTVPYISNTSHVLPAWFDRFHGRLRQTHSSPESRDVAADATVRAIQP